MIASQYVRGSPYHPPTSKVSVYLNGSQSIPSATWTKVLFDTELFDIDDEYSNGRFTAKVAGYYLVTSQIVFEDIDAVNNSLIVICKNGPASDVSKREGENWCGAVITTCRWLDSTIIVYLDVGDYIEVYAYQDKPATANNVLGYLANQRGRGHTYLHIAKLA